MQTLIDLDNARPFAVPVLDPVRGSTMAEGLLVEGPQGWGEFSPAQDADAGQLGRWLTAATEPGTIGWPDAVRGRVPVAVSVPAVGPVRAREIVRAAGCRTADVEVGDPVHGLAGDAARVAAVRAELGTSGLIRCDARGRWEPAEAVNAIAALEQAAGGVEFVAQPCRELQQVAWVRARVAVRIAADAGDPHRVREAADIAVLRCGRLGGARRALRVAELAGLPCVVVSDAWTGIGVATGLALAGALPELGYAAALGTRLLLGGDVVGDGRSLVPVDGSLPVAPMPPGPDPGLLGRFALTDAARIERLRQQLRAATAQ
ncbi:O-succinylbenzoate-CoA synthase [Mycolicibacterium canariasense]|uniref:O-succinylbenzoate-CoA synthase n=1 Tax=Mycolicibacterium canariasense TaxID=228230 RepID=A0A100W8J9_MYCCR|nr:enolase C-terminal domain-like protein [Mycolicibacterium canariasense]MCV7210975.1 O-succinylbenzoate synthase [Mycolicibacterium canariasense]ORU96908.1 O-succinylbenzoate synthase [Mycolicibacterium canariasense]GAS93391.1 O-succinylbenzoate-CoA synthase [Mycolicibacterium canariasense]